MKITKETHPYIVKAFNLVDLDNGAVNRVEGNLRTEYTIPPAHIGFLQDAEMELSKLPDEDLDMLCTGDYDSIQVITRKHQIDTAHTLIGDYFNGWEPEPE